MTDLLDHRRWRRAEELSRYMMHALESINNNDLPAFDRWSERVREILMEEDHE